MATNSPTPSGNNAGPRKATPPKKTISPLAAIGALVGIGVGIYLISWVISGVVASAMTTLTNDSLANFGLPATIVILLAFVIVASVLGRRK
jgi:hypothetical protein